MAAVITPIVLKNADLILGEESTGTDYGIELASIQLTPNVDVQRIKTVKPEGRFASVDDPEWNLDLGYVWAQRNDSGVALGDYLLAHVGEQVPFTFRPVSGGVGYGGTVTVVPGAMGGQQGQFSNQTVSLPLEGQPAAVEAPAQG